LGNREQIRGSMAQFIPTKSSGQQIRHHIKGTPPSIAR
jgi:hypothetical protein